MRRLRDRLLDGLFPLACTGCARILRGPAARLGPLCDVCRTSLAAPPPPLCARCGVPLGRADPLHGSGACRPCRVSPPAFALARGAALYDPSGTTPALVGVLHAFKYGGMRTLSGPLAALITERLPLPPGAVVVPVPLHRVRLRERRYNQAALLARAVATRAGRPLGLRVLVRRLHAAPQATLGAAERRANLRDAFRVADPATIVGRHVVLLDDVITTTATADACARALLAAGARRVDVFAVGRTPHPCGA